VSVFVAGNQAIVQGALRAGCNFLADVPITVRRGHSSSNLIAAPVPANCRPLFDRRHPDDS